jgi:hypothetical protein
MAGRDGSALIRRFLNRTNDVDPVGNCHTPMRSSSKARRAYADACSVRRRRLGNQWGVSISIRMIHARICLGAAVFAALFMGMR